MKRAYVAVLVVLGTLTCGCAGTFSDISWKDESIQNEVIKAVDYRAEDYLVLGDYKHIIIDESELEVPEEEIDEEISEILEEYQQIAEVTDRGIEKGDIANITSRGYDNDKEVDTLTTYSYNLTIGDNVFGQTYEEQLLGAEAGETIEFDVTYDEDYDSERIAGKTIHYVVKINNVFELLDQELTDEYVEELTDSEYTTVEEFRQGCADMLMEDNKDRYVLTAGKQKLLEESEITGYPEEALEEDIEELREFYEGGASYVNMELADYLSTLTGRDKESSEEVLEQIAKDNLTEEMLIKAVAEKEEITLTDEEYETYLEEYLEELGDETTAEELEFAFGEENIKEAFTLKKTENYLLQLWEDQAE